jgi:hypothetical protein
MEITTIVDQRAEPDSASSRFQFVEHRSTSDTNFEAKGH